MLTPAMQDELRKSYECCDVTLSLPTFKSNQNTDLKDILADIGVSSLENADFSPMGLGIFPVATIHKTSVKIDEEGAEMAAVTGGWLGTAGPDDTDLRHVAIDFNRPFLYIVKNYHTGAILMAGVVTHPQ